MWRLLFNTCVLVAVTTHATAQYADFFQGLNAFLQPFTTKRPHIVTKRPESKHRSNKDKHDDVYQTDQFKEEPLNVYSSASRKSTKSSHDTRPTSKPKLVNSNKINSNRNEVRSIINDPYNNNIDYNRQTTQRNQYTTQRNQFTTQRNQFTTQRNQFTTQRNQHTPQQNWGYDTTSNPLLNRPGVKPAVVDENRPPITNRPLTSRPVTSRPVYDIPSDSGTYRPVNTRPPFETDRPRVQNPSDTRPANTRPPFEVERPVTSRPSRPVITEDELTVKDPVIEVGADENAMSEVQKRRYYEICEEKCAEYKAAHTRKVVALPLAGNQRAEVNVSSCARANVPLIIGGTVADIKQFPHMALVGWKKLQSAGYSWKCGGSLVSERYVLTAGHCTYYDKDDKIISGPPRAVQLGASRIDGNDATVVRIETIIRHHEYKLRRSYYDIAVIKLVKTVTFTDKISPACLGVPPPVGSPIVATGWGKTEFGGDHSVELRSVSFPVWDMAECREVWGTSRKLPQGPQPDSQLCAGERRGAKDTCQGDSGGPAQIADGCVWRVVAITSVGRSCGAPETPALYAKVPRAFIASVIYSNAKTNREIYNDRGNDGNNRGNGGTSNNNRGNDGNNWGNAGSNNRGNDDNNWGNGGTSRPNRGNDGNNWGNGSSGNRGSDSNRGSSSGVSNDREIGTVWGTVNNNQGTTNDNRGSEGNIWGIVGNNEDNTNNNRGTENNSWGNVNNNRGSVNNNRGTENNNRGTGNNNVGNKVPNVRPDVNNGRYPSIQRPDTTGNNRYDNQNNGYDSNRNVYETPRTTTVTVGYPQNGYNEQSGYNRNNNKPDNYYPVSVPWWTK